MKDATTLLKFRHLLEKNELGKALFNDINERLDKAGLMMHSEPEEGTDFCICLKKGICAGNTNYITSPDRYTEGSSAKWRRFVR